MKALKQILTIAIVMVIASCSSPRIHMKSAMPSRVDFGKNASIRVSSSWTGSYKSPRLYEDEKAAAARDIKRSIESALMNSSYYNLSDSYACPNVITCNVDTMGYNHTQAGSKLTFQTMVEGRCGNSLVFRYSYNNSASDQGYGYDFSVPGKFIAEDVMDAIEPYIYSYYEPIDSSSPDIEKAVQACNAGLWPQGEAYAKQALAADAKESEAYFILGLVERNNRNWAASDSYFDKAYSAKPRAKYLNAIKRNRSLRKNEDNFHAQMK